MVTYQTLDNLLKTNEALKQFATSSKQLTQAQKAIARLIVTMQAGSNAFGDMSATVDTLQNSMRVMQGSLANLKLAIGDAFASKPALMFYQLVGGIAQGITNIIRAFIPLQTELDRPIEDTFFNELNDDIDETMGKMGLLSFDKFEVLGAGGSSALAENLAITAALTTELKKQQEEYDKIFMASSGIASKAVEIGKTISAWFINVDENGGFVSWTEQMQPLVNIVKSIASNIKIIYTSLSPIIAKLMPQISKIITTLLPLISDIVLAISSIITAITPIIDLLLGDILTTLIEAIVMVLPVVQPILKLLTFVVNIVSPIIKIILDVVSSILRVLSPLLGIVAAIIGWIIDTPIVGILQLIFFAITPIIAAFELLAKIVMTVFEVLRSIFTLNFKDLGSKLSSIWSNWEVSKYVTANMNVQYKANGGTFDLRGGTAIGVVNERENELIYSNNARQVEVSNQQSLKESFLQALIEYHSLTAEEQQKLVVELRDKTGSGIVQMLTPQIFAEGRRTGQKI